jgi:hypothetical protein
MYVRAREDPRNAQGRSGEREERNTRKEEMKGGMEGRLVLIQHPRNS